MKSRTVLLLGSVLGLTLATATMAQAGVIFLLPVLLTGVFPHQSGMDPEYIDLWTYIAPISFYAFWVLFFAFNLLCYRVFASSRTVLRKSLLIFLLGVGFYNTSYPFNPHVIYMRFDMWPKGPIITAVGTQVYSQTRFSKGFSWSKFRNLKPGMTFRDVRASLGLPLRSFERGGNSFWRHDHPASHPEKEIYADSKIGWSFWAPVIKYDSKGQLAKRYLLHYVD